MLLLVHKPFCSIKSTEEGGKETVHKMKLKRLISSIVALALALGMLVSALAAEYDISQGSVTIEASGSVEAGDYVQTVTHGSNAPVVDAAPVIIQEGSGSTSNTITISTSGDAEANLTIRDINISDVYGQSAIDVGDSKATINVEGQNTIKVDYDNSPTGDSGSTALVHVSGGELTITSETSGKLDLENQFSHGAVIGSNKDEDLSGDIHITGNVNLIAGTTTDTADGAGIGSGENGNMSGSISIDGDAQVEAAGQDEGAGIGSGEGGNMSGTISISGNAQVKAVSDDDGAGIGSGEDGEMFGTISISGNAQVKAVGGDNGAGIGSGEDGNMFGTISISGDARVEAVSDDDGAGIGSGEDGKMSGTISIGGNAQVKAYAHDDGAGIGAGKSAIMSGRIFIKDEAIVYSGSSSGAEIGSDNGGDMRGQILILDQAAINTGRIDSNGNFTPDPNGLIGDGDNNHHNSAYGVYVFGDGITINGISGSNIEELKKNVNMYLDGEENDGDVVNLAVLSITRNEDGTYSASVTGGAGEVEKLLYGGSETIPAAPGSYPVTVMLAINGEVVEIEIGTLVIPAGQTEALFRVTDREGRDISYKAEHANGVLTITVDADYAILTGKLSGIEVLKSQGIEKIEFITGSADSTFQTSKLLENGGSGDEYKLTHDGEGVSFIIGEKKTDVSSILIKP